MGGGFVLLNKKPSIKEIANDLDYPTYKMWADVKSGWLLKVQQLSYSQNTFNFYLDKKNFDRLKYPDRWVSEREFVLRNMSRGGLKKNFSKSKRLRGGRNEGDNLWINKCKNLPEIMKRVRGVDFYNVDGIDCLRKFNQANMLSYIDPPYLQSTRTAKNAYDKEMSERQHEILLDFLLKDYKGLAILSGYPSLLYDKRLVNWNRHEKTVKNNSGQNIKKQSRIEVLWKNF